VPQNSPAFRDEAVLGFVDRYGSAATREVAEVFEVSGEVADEALQRLTAAGLLECVPAETGRLYRAVRGEGFCDPATAVCG
jgi:Mn-dependent DtxR family transcriptional regulator